MVVTDIEQLVELASFSRVQHHTTVYPVGVRTFMQILSLCLAFCLLCMVSSSLFKALIACVLVLRPTGTTEVFYATIPFVRTDKRLAATHTV